MGGGGVIDLVIHLAKLDFPAACRLLAAGFLPLATSRRALSFPRSWQESPHPQKKSFEELATLYAVREDSNWTIARDYPVEQRKIPPPLVDELHGRGSIYANDHRPNPSIVFLHRDQEARCAEPVFGIPNISPYSARALEMSLPPGLQSEISPRRIA